MPLSTEKVISGFTLMGVLLASACFAACGKNEARHNVVVSVSGNQPNINCSAPGCPCTSPGATRACGKTQSVDGDNLVCGEGTSTCQGGLWGACSIERTVTKYAPFAASGNHLLNLAETPVDCSDLCNPDCSVFNDTPPGLDPGPNFVVNGNGLTLPGRSGGGTCADVVVTPAVSTVTVTSLRPMLVLDPPSVQLAASCGTSGQPIVPTWLMRPADADVARVDSQGVVRVLAGVAKSVQVLAVTSAGSSTATVNIVVDVDQVDPGCDASSFAAGTGADPGRTLYPYAVPSRPVLFPLGFGGPLVQWATGGTNADCVKVSLDYPGGAATKTFHWSRVFAPSGGSDPKLGSVDTAQPAAPIPDDVWQAFSLAAAGQVGEIGVQRRRVGAAVAYQPMPPIPVEFATDAVRGTAFFTQYLRRLRDDQNRNDTDICEDEEDGRQPDIDLTDARYRTSVSNGCVNGDCSGNAGPSCPVGNCTRAKTFSSQVASLQALDLANPTLGLTAPFRGASSNSRCLACHSVSADGSKLVAADYDMAGMGTVATLDSSSGRPNATSIADAPTYSLAGNRGDPMEPEREQSRGLAYAALTPNGSYVLTGPNFWGNTDFDVPLGQNNQQDAGYPGGGRRYFMLEVERLRINVEYATAAALPNHGATGDELNGATNGTLRIDGTEVREGDSVLVKNEPNAAENGVYTVARSSSMRPFRLVRRVDNGPGAELSFGDKFRVESGASNAGKYMHVASASAAPIVVGDSLVSFALYATVSAATTGALPSYSVSVSGGVVTLQGAGSFSSSWIDGVPSADSLSILVKDEVGANAVYNGIYQLESSDGAPWRLTRRSDADADPELSAGARVRVNQGVQFGGKTFMLSNASVTLGVSLLSFVVDDLLDEGTKYDRGGVASTLPTMMYPTFSPDGGSLVYVNGDADTLGTGAAPTGWRRGLSLLSFDASNPARPFSNKRRLLSTFDEAASGAVMKWPSFEPDSRGVLFVQSSGDEFCRTRPTRGTAPGRTATPARRRCRLTATSSARASSGATTVSTATATVAPSRAGIGRGACGR
ncbi:MAG: hypothetical protein QM756_28730 [Polyangiaceae bacterium]